MRAQTQLLAEPTSAGEARRFVSRTLGDWGASEALDVVTLLVSELVTNSLLHARSAMELAVELAEDRLRITVCDDSAALPVLLELDDGTLTGRGLSLVDTCAERWGVDPIPSGKAVWFEVAASA